MPGNNTEIRTLDEVHQLSQQRGEANTSLVSFIIPSGASI